MVVISPFHLEERQSSSLAGRRAIVKLPQSVAHNMPWTYFSRTKYSPQGSDDKKAESLEFSMRSGWGGQAQQVPGYNLSLRMSVEDPEHPGS